MTEHRPPNARIRWALLIAALASAGLAARAIPRAPQASAAADPIPVRTALAAREVHPLPPLRLSGRVEAPTAAIVGFEVGGAVAAVVVEAGASVAKGDVLARLDPSRLRAAADALTAQQAAAQARLEELVAGPRLEQVERARAAVAAATTRSTLAAATAVRHRDALATESVSAQAEEAARREAEIAAAALQEATATLAELLAGTRSEQLAAQRAAVDALAAQRQALQRDLADVELRAPFAAIVQGRHIDPGHVLAAGAPAFRLIAASGLRVRVGVPSRLAAAEAEALRARASVRVHGRPVAVDSAGGALLPEVDARLRTVDLLLPLTDSAGLRAGDHAEVLVPAGSRDGIAVPLQALRAGPRGLFRCFVAMPRGDGFRAEYRDLLLGEPLGDRVLVNGGLQAGEQLVLAVPDHLLPGMAVQPTEVR